MSSSAASGRRKSISTKKTGKKPEGVAVPKHAQSTTNEIPTMSENEKERITEVFKIYETDVRSAAMNPEVSFHLPIILVFYGSIKLKFSLLITTFY